MTRALVLGAGATLAEALRQRGANGKQPLPPLDRGFFRAVSGIGVRRTDLDTVADYLDREHGIDCLSSRWDSMESVLIRIVSDCLMTNDPVKKQDVTDVFTALMRLYARGLLDTTSWMKALRTNFLYRCFAAWLRDVGDSNDIHVLTFNHDLEVEKTLTAIGNVRRYKKYGGTLSLPYSYGSQLVQARTFGPGRVERFDVSNTEPTHYVWLFKLHGSLNWASVHDSADPPFNEVLSSTRDLRWTSRTTIPSAMRIRENGQTRYAVPLVVPPVHNKASIMPPALTSLWEEAEVALQEADEVTLVGYSCPDADAEAENLLRRGLRQNGSPNLLTIVNPDSSSVGRFAEIVPGVPIRYFPSLDAWDAAGF